MSRWTSNTLSKSQERKQEVTQSCFLIENIYHRHLLDRQEVRLLLKQMRICLHVIKEDEVLFFEKKQKKEMSVSDHKKQIWQFKQSRLNYNNLEKMTPREIHTLKKRTRLIKAYEDNGRKVKLAASTVGICNSTAKKIIARWRADGKTYDRRTRTYVPLMELSQSESISLPNQLPEEGNSSIVHQGVSEPMSNSAPFWWPSYYYSWGFLMTFPEGNIIPCLFLSDEIHELFFGL